MSFQGDVAGLGLGELLQGLGRGGRDGVLNLFSKRCSVSLGVHRGQVYLLVGPDENDEEWQRRAANAWADSSDHDREAARRTRIARADRLERLYRLLETSNLHFQFEQGPLPPAPGALQARASSHSSVSLSGDDAYADSDPVLGWGKGMTAEYLLLEHARISDEAADAAVRDLDERDVPRLLDARQHSPQELDLLQHFDGNSTLLEVCDRVGLPLTTVRAKLVPYLKAGTVRIADPRELLAACQRELELGRTLRAASRLTGWIRKTPSGPPNVGDADLLVGEWDRGRLINLLPVLPAREARTLLRKLDHVHVDKRASRQRWSALQQIHRTDELILLHEVGLRLVDLEDPDASTFQDLLRLARSFQERGQASRTRMLLQLAATHLPARPLVRIELGRRMLEVGLEEDGIAWLLDTARELVDRDEPERALIAARAVLKHDDENDEAKRLTVAAHQSVRKRRRRKAGTTVAIAACALIALVALVRFQFQRTFTAKLDAITGLAERPEEALAKFDDYFPNPDDDQQLVGLRQRLVQRIETQRKLDYDHWHLGYDEVAEVATAAPLEEALERVLALSLPPHHRPSDPFTERQDLLGILSARIVDESAALDVGIEGSEADLAAEAELLASITRLRRRVTGKELGPETDSFRFGLEELEQSIAERRRARNAARSKEDMRQREKDLDILLARARAHAKAGELEEAVDAFERLLEVDPELRELDVVMVEYDRIALHHRAVEEALRLAEAGQHTRAAEALGVLGQDAGLYPMPWRVESEPSGARVQLQDGTVRTTPFQHRSPFGTELRLRFEYSGYQPREVEVRGPADLRVHLFRHPEFAVDTGGRVEAAPVVVDSDYVLVDRRGGVRRITADGRTAWEETLTTLGGIARRPVPVPRRSDMLLVVTEEGRAWFVNAGTGRLEGPSNLGSAPKEGPYLHRGSVSYVLRNRRTAVFQSSVEPAIHEPGEAPRTTHELEPEVEHFAILERSATADLLLESPWTSWTAEVLTNRVRLTDGDRVENVERLGDWSYLAWEKPTADAPNGRLWISDESGVRAFRPDRR